MIEPCTSVETREWKKKAWAYPRCTEIFDGRYLQPAQIQLTFLKRVQRRFALRNELWCQFHAGVDSKRKQGSTTTLTPPTVIIMSGFDGNTVFSVPILADKPLGSTLESASDTERMLLDFLLQYHVGGVFIYR